MSYYFFNKCEENCLQGLEKIANNLKLTETPSTIINGRFWSGYVLDARKKFNRELIMAYNPGSQTPLMVQTNVQKQTPQIKGIVKSLIELCRPTEIYKEPITRTKYDLKDFED